MSFVYKTVFLRLYYLADGWFFLKLNYLYKSTLLWIICRNRCISPSFCTAWLSAYARMCSSLSLLRNNFLQPGTLHFSAFSGHSLMCMVTWHLTYTMERKDQHMKLNLFDAMLHVIRDLSYRRQVWPGIVARNYLGRGRVQTPEWRFWSTLIQKAEALLK